jgi:hypothetical protein
MKHSPKKFQPQASDIDLKQSNYSAEKFKLINIDDSEERKLDWNNNKKMK